MKEHACSCSVLVRGVRYFEQKTCSCSVRVLALTENACSCSVRVRALKKSTCSCSVRVLDSKKFCVRVLGFKMAWDKVALG